MDKTTYLSTGCRSSSINMFVPSKRCLSKCLSKIQRKKAAFRPKGLVKPQFDFRAPKTWGTKLRLYGCKRWSFVHFRKMSLKTSKVTKDLHLLELHPHIQGTNGSDGKWRLLQAFQLLCSAISAAAIMPDFPLHCHPRPQCPGRKNPPKKNVDPRCWVHNLLSSY